MTHHSHDDDNQTGYDRGTGDQQHWRHESGQNAYGQIDDAWQQVRANS